MVVLLSDFYCLSHRQAQKMQILMQEFWKISITTRCVNKIRQGVGAQKFSPRLPNPALSVFTQVNGSERANKTAEQALGAVILWNDLTFDYHSAAGSNCSESLFTVVTTLPSQGRSVLNFPIKVLRSEFSFLLPLASE